MGKLQYRLFVSFLWYIYIFISDCVWFSCCLSDECIPYMLLMFMTKTLKTKTLNPSLNWDFLLRLCWIVPLALGTISGTNIFGSVAGDEAEAYLPWDTYHFSWFERWTRTSIFKGYFHQIWTHWLLEVLVPGADLHLLCYMVWQTLKRLSKQQESSEGPNLFQLLVILTSWVIH